MLLRSFLGAQFSGLLVKNRITHSFGLHRLKAIFKAKKNGTNLFFLPQKLTKLRPNSDLIHQGTYLRGNAPRVA